jgi:hypothetical protein
MSGCQVCNFYVTVKPAPSSQYTGGVNAEYVRLTDEPGKKRKLGGQRRPVNTSFVGIGGVVCLAIGFPRRG